MKLAQEVATNGKNDNHTTHPAGMRREKEGENMKGKYTLKMFLEDYEGFDFELGTIVLFDADLCRQYLLSSKTYRMMYLTEERLQKAVYDWTHDDKVITIILKDTNQEQAAR